MISGRWEHRQEKLARDQINALQRGALDGGEITWCEFAALLRPCSSTEVPLQRRRIVCHAQSERVSSAAIARRTHHHRRDDLAPARGDAGGERMFDFCVGSRRDIHRREQRAQRRFGNGVAACPTRRGTPSAMP